MIYTKKTTSKRVIVIGSPGAGKSTFARQLRDWVGLPLYYLDMIWHLPDRTTITAEEFDQKLMGILNSDRWIIDGNYARTLEKRLQFCDTVFLLDYPLDVCLDGAKRRVEIKREEIPWIEEETGRGSTAFENPGEMETGLYDAAGKIGREI